MRMHILMQCFKPLKHCKGMFCFFTFFLVLSFSADAKSLIEIDLTEVGSVYSFDGSSILSQEREITGRVTDTEGVPVADATISAGGSEKQTSTDQEGRFTIVLSRNDSSLIVSSIGYKTQEIVIDSNADYQVTLQEDTMGLEEVVAVGYGVQKKVSITNAVSSISGDELTNRNSTNATQALQGKLSGLTIIDRGGSPGAENLTTRIRGVTSLNDNNPLVLIDGVPGSLARVNPVDIESVSVLKDAASTAIYGSRASAGVILVTTKASKDGKLSVSYNGFYGLARPNNTPVHMDAITYMKQQNQAYLNTNGQKFYSDEHIENWLENHRNEPEKYPEPNTWQDALYHLASQHSHTIAISGGDSEKVTNRISARYQAEDGILPNYGFKIAELRSKNDFKVFDKLTVGANINARFSDRKAPVSEWESYYRMWQNSQWATPVYSDGSYGLSVDSFSPLIAAKERGQTDTKTTYLSGIFRADYQVNNTFRVTAQYSSQYEAGLITDFTNQYDFTDHVFPERRMFNTINAMRDNRTWMKEDGLDLHLNYNREINEHQLSALLGYSEIYHQDNWAEAARQDFYNNDLQAISMGANDGTQSARGENSEWGLRSFFGRANYDYQSKYLLEINARYDGSSRFAAGNRFGFFPSFSAGWRISSESFWEPVKEIINELKFRGSWGQVGSQQVGLYSYMPTYRQRNYIYNGSPVTGFRQTNLANQDISWETTTQMNIGVDGGLWNGLINFSFDYYEKRTDDILLLVPIPGMVGLDPTSQNAGVVENKGMEALIQFNKSFSDYHFGIGFNVNYNQNTVVDLAGTGPHVSAYGDSDYRTITTEGKPIGSYYGFQTDGFFQSQQEVDSYAKWDQSVGAGDLKYVDQNNDGVLSADDFVVFGKEMPDWTFSSNMSFGWKNLTLDLFWQGVSGSEKIMTGAIMEHGIWGGFTHAVYADYWTEENTGARYPRPTKYTMKNAQLSDFWMVDGSYIRLKNARLSYDFPLPLCEKIGASGVGVYISATNLLTFSKLNKYHIDPEMEGRGQEASFPQTSVSTIGLNINF